jgi:hypothetical protein
MNGLADVAGKPKRQEKDRDREVEMGSRAAIFLIPP